MNKLIRCCFLLAVATTLSACSLVQRIARMDSLEPRKTEEKLGEKGSAKVSVTAQRVGPDSIWINGYVTELEIGDAVLFGAIAVYDKDKLIVGCETDFDGYFSAIIPLEIIRSNSNLRLEVSYLGMLTLSVAFPDYSPGDQLVFDIRMVEEEMTINPFLVPYYWPPVYDQGELGSGQTFTSDQIRRSPTRG